MTENAQATAEVVSAQNISRIFGEGTSGFQALDNISLSIREGQFVSVVGPSGCGKSTLMQIIGGLDAPTRGEVRIDGEPITGPRPDKIGVVFQEALLLPWKTAAENIEFPLSLSGVPPAKRRARAMELLDLVGLVDFAGRFPHELSGGMKQRVAIARGLVRNPRLLLMDEPFGALDEQTRTRMWEELLRVQERSHATILFITHSLVEAVYLADEVLVMASRPGRIVERIVVGLPRPRSLDMLGSERLGKLRNQIWHLIAEPQETNQETRP
ncbi:MAG TPA: ABC transporter ATP-binding protein [Xanthobacteraceae bacterium]|jgi:NitT/TauT family transport system ATP-binding protein|nr:ABC transporter ATP-binding protein [Xanthobacteraceae bacterium]